MGGHAMSGSHWKHKEDKEQGPVPYKECGLDDVFLISGYTVVETKHGRGMAIKDLDELSGDHSIW
jgi:hypothetical protein